jgi:inward rectifier potassium channel
MFRMVNTQPGELTDVQVRMSLTMFETVDGKRERNFFALELERNTVDLFTLHWTVVHPITATSPLRGITPEGLREAQAEILILVSAHEETFSTRVTQRASYWWDEVRWDAKFASIFASSADDAIAIDVERLDRLERLDEGATARPAALESGEGVVAGRL